MDLFDIPVSRVPVVGTSDEFPVHRAQELLEVGQRKFCVDDVNICGRFRLFVHVNHIGIVKAADNMLGKSDMHHHWLGHLTRSL